MDAPDTTPDTDPTPTPDHQHSSLRGSLVAVILMATFFAATWFAVFAIAMERR